MAGGKWLPAALVAGVWLGSLGLAPAEAASLSPSSPAVIAGNSVTLTLNDSIAANTGVGAVDLLVTFDSTLLRLVSVTDGTLLTNWDAPLPNYSNGLISISEGVNGNDAQGAGSVVLLTFSAFSSDKSAVTPIAVQTTSSAVGVSGEYQLLRTTDAISIAAAPPISVPEPGTLVLMLVPMLAAACTKLRGRC